MSADLIFELKRKSLHISSLWIPLVCYFSDREYALIIIGMVTVVAAGFDWLRLMSKSISAIFITLFGFLLRNHEEAKLTGSTYMLFSALVTLQLFGNVIAATAIAFLIVGDTLAALIGKRFGSIKLGQKSLQGSGACLAGCLLIMLIVPELSLRQGLCGAVTATLVELLPGPVDDNITMPFAAGIVMALV